VFLFKRNVELPQQRQVFVAKRFLAMVFFLIPDVLNHVIELRMPIGKGSKTFLPTEFTANPFLLIYESR
jgi:hypothetical protein